MSQNKKNPEMGLNILVVCKDEDRFLPVVQRLSERGHATESTTSVYGAVVSFARRPPDVDIVELAVRDDRRCIPNEEPSFSCDFLGSQRHRSGGRVYVLYSSDTDCG